MHYNLSKTIDISRLFAYSMLVFYVISLVFSLMRENKGNFLS